MINLLENIIRLSTYRLYPITGLEKPLGFQEVEAPKISRKSAHESGKVG
jgi:hypothetical protein